MSPFTFVTGHKQASLCTGTCSGVAAVSRILTPSRANLAVLTLTNSQAQTILTPVYSPRQTLQHYSTRVWPSFLLTPAPLQRLSGGQNVLKTPAPAPAGVTGSHNNIVRRSIQMASLVLECYELWVYVCLRGGSHVRSFLKLNFRSYKAAKYSGVSRQQVDS